MDGCMEGCMDVPCTGVVPPYVRMNVRTYAKNVRAHVLYVRSYVYGPLCPSWVPSDASDRFRPSWAQIVHRSLHEVFELLDVHESSSDLCSAATTA